MKAITDSEKPIAVKVSDIDDKRFRAVIEIGIFRLCWVEIERDGSLILEYKARLDGAIIDIQSLDVPKVLFNAAKNQAYAIRRTQRLKRAHQR